MKKITLIALASVALLVSAGYAAFSPTNDTKNNNQQGMVINEGGHSLSTDQF